MSTISNGFIVDCSDDEGVGVIPAPPSPQETVDVNPNHFSSSYVGNGSTITSIGSSCPSRDSVSAAIALVRAKQMAKAAIQRAEDEVLQPRSFSSDLTSTSVATDLSTKSKGTNNNDNLIERENTIPITITSQSGEKSTTSTQAPIASSNTDESLKETKQQDQNSFLSMVNDVFSSRSEAQASSASASLPKNPSFEQLSATQHDDPSTAIPSSSDGIPALPSLTTNESNDSDSDEMVDSKTIEDVNAFLNRLGVGALGSASNESSNKSSIHAVDSIEKLRMLSSNSSDASSDETDNDDENSSIGEVQPETLAEISAFINAIAKKEEERKERRQDEEDEVNISLEKLEILEQEMSMEADEESEPYTGDDAEAQVRTSRPSPIYELLADATLGACKDPPSTLALENPNQKADPPGPSHMSEAVTQTRRNGEENPFIDHSYAAESLESSPPTSVAVEEEKKKDDDNGDDDDQDADDDEDYETRFVDTSFAASVRKALSTVEEVTSMEADDDNSSEDDDVDENNGVVGSVDTYDELLLEALGTGDSSSSKQDEGYKSQASTLLAVASEEASIYGVDGKKEPKGIYEKAKVEVEEIPVSNIGVEQTIDNEMSLMSRMSSTDSQHIGSELYAIIEQNQRDDESKLDIDDTEDQKDTAETAETNDADSSVRSRGFSETGSVPWALRDVASEETMRATGRRRPRFVVSGPRPSNKSRNIASLFDDTSQQASEAASEFNTDGSFGSDKRNGDDDGNDNDVNKETEIEDASVEAERCVVDTLIYNDYEPEDDYAVQRGTSEGNSNDENDKAVTIDKEGLDPTESCDMLVVDESGEVEIMAHDSCLIDKENDEIEEDVVIEGTEQSEGIKGNEEETERATSQVEEDHGDQKLVKDPSAEMPAFEVGQGPLSPTKITKFVATIDHQHIIGADQKQNVQHFKELIVPLIDGHEPTLVELAQIRQAAQRANLSLELVDQFLDDVTRTSPYLCPNSSSLDELVLKSWGTSFDSHNEDDDDVEAFLVRVEEARVAAIEAAAVEAKAVARRAIAAVTADIEATIKAEEEAAEEATEVAKQLIAAVSTEIEAAMTAEEEAMTDNVSLSTSYITHNEDDDDVHACLVRVEEARVAATKKEISAIAADIEASFRAEEEARAKNAASSTDVETAVTSEEDVAIEHSNSFLRQFEDLDLKEELETDGSLKQNDPLVAISQDTSVDDFANTMSPKMLINYFSTIDQRKFEGENEEKFLDDFKKLMMPVVNGSKPTLIEEAQIRQAALKANVPLDFVDAFVDYVKDEHPELALQVSKDDRDFLLKGWEEIEDLNEDAAIAAFLSSKFGAQISDEGDHQSKEAQDDLCETKSQSEKAIQEKKAKEMIGASSHDYEPEGGSPTYMIEPDFNRSEDTKPDFNRSNEETDCEQSEYKTIYSDNLQASKEFEEEETNEDFSLSIPKVVGTIKRHENDPVDTEMLKACKSIESYDEGIWQRRTAMATYGWGWEERTWLSQKKSPRALSGAGINGMAAAEGVSNFLFNKQSFPLARKNCKLSYKRRVKSHTGYFDVDVHSLQESAAFGEENLHKDETPWELRYVRQRFLHERSLTFSRNWFGNLVKTGGNDKIKAPVCKPKSMEMPMRNIPDPGDWTPEWYTTWGGSKLLLRRPSTEGSIDSGGSDSDTEKNYDGESSYSSSSSYEDDDEDWEDAPECGTLVNTKQKIGEHVTRVHPDYTSSLRKSRWRKKYFPVGTFPY